MFLEHVFSEGEHKSVSNDTLAGLQFFMPPVQSVCITHGSCAKCGTGLNRRSERCPLVRSCLQVWQAWYGPGAHHEIAAALLIGFDAMDWRADSAANGPHILHKR